MKTIPTSFNILKETLDLEARGSLWGTDFCDPEQLQNPEVFHATVAKLPTHLEKFKAKTKKTKTRGARPASIFLPKHFFYKKRNQLATRKIRFLLAQL